MQRKLFVSHSSKTQENLALLQEVCTGLGQAGFEILVDRGGQLYAGIDWDLRLNEWMAECHAAVILFSTAALRDSDWVAKEAAILSWRRELQDDFILIPVLLEGITPEELEQGLYGILRITKDQCIHDATDAQKIIADVATGLGPAVRQPSTPFERLERVLSTILEQQAQAETLEDTWDALDGENKPQWQPNSGRRFASALVRFMLRDRRQAMQHLETVLDRIRPRVDRDAAEELVKYLSCLWVDAEAAAGISAASRSGGVVGLNGNYLSDFTAERYGERAWPLSDRWRLIPIDASQRTPAAMLDVIRETFRPKGGRFPDAAIDRRIRQSREPVVVLIPGSGENAPIPDDALCSELRRQYPNLVFLVGTGSQVPQWVPRHIEMLMPPLDVSIEEEQYWTRYEVQEFISRLHGSP